MRIEPSTIDCESELLVISAMNHPDLSGGRMEEILAEGPDWQYLLQGAARHGLVPLLYRTLIKARDLVPPAVLTDLRKSYFFNSKRSLIMIRELLALLDRLEEGGISAVPFKGPVLAQELYGDVALRMFTDLDVLVRREDARRAKEILLSEDYRLGDTLTDAAEKIFLRSHHHYHLYGQGNVHVEVHWQVSPGIYCFSLNTEELIARSARRAMFGKELRTISHGDLFLILCEHGARHYWRRLAWIADLSRLAESREIEWDEVTLRSKRTGCQRLLLLGLFLAKRLLYAPIPPEIPLDTKEEEKVSGLVEETVKRLFARDQKIAPASSLPDIDLELFYLRARERFRDKAGYYIRRATTPTEDDWRSLPLPSHLASLYYAVRPVRLMNKYGLEISRWLKGG